MAEWTVLKDFCITGAVSLIVEYFKSSKGEIINHLQRKNLFRNTRVAPW